jgi:excinuclease ABC subunit A
MRRFNTETLEVRYGGRSISQVLDLTVAEGLEAFAAHPRIHRYLDVLDGIGLGYLALGQASHTLSGGEAQRIKLAYELGKEPAGRTLYVLDEPTTGLHVADVTRLITVLRRLVARGDSVLVIEHNLDLIAACDWMIDLGPEGGEAGGRLVTEGEPLQVARHGKSHTAASLRESMAISPRPPGDRARPRRASKPAGRPGLRTLLRSSI